MYITCDYKLCTFATLLNTRQHIKLNCISKAVGKLVLDVFLSCGWRGLAVVKQGRVQDCAIFAELHRKLQGQVRPSQIRRVSPVAINTT